MNKERLLELRRVVENAPDDRFQMSKFCTKTACGTAYCAAGWAAIDPWFKANTEIREIFHVREISPNLYAVGACAGAFAKLADLFNVEASDADALFGGELNEDDDAGKVSKAEVLANIDKLLADEPAEAYAATREND